MPSEKRRGAPHIPAIGFGLVKIAEMIERDFPNDEWDEEFTKRVKRVLGAYGGAAGRPQWSSDFGKLVKTSGWKAWMTQVPAFKHILEADKRRREYRESYQRSLQAEDG